MAVELSFILYNTIWMVPFLFPYLLVLILNRAFPSKKAFLVILGSFAAFILVIIANVAYAALILTTYGGEFTPGNDLLVGILIHASITELFFLVIIILAILSVKAIKPYISELDIDPSKYKQDLPPQLASYLDDKDTNWLVNLIDSNDGRYILAVFFSWLSLFFTFETKPLNVSYILRYLGFLMGTLTNMIVLLFIGMTIITSLLLGRTLRAKLGKGPRTESTVQQYVMWITGLFWGMGIVTIFVHDMFGLGISIIALEEVYFPAIYYGAVAVILVLVLASPSLLARMDLKNIKDAATRKKRAAVGSGYYLTRLAAAVLIIFFIGLPLLAVPVTSVIPQLEKSKTALESQIKIADDPIEEYPLNLTDLRVVSRDLAKDISLSRLPQPPKSYTLKVLTDYEVIGMINNRPAWVIPMRYESFFNIETNILAGHISVYLDDPIPEHITIKFEEMVVGPGLTGYRDIRWLATQARPQSMIGELSFMDPYVDGKPAWLVVLDKYNSWGLRIASEIMVIHKDGNYEFITPSEALSIGFPEIISESAIKDIVTEAGLYLRNGLFDPTANGLVTIPPSPDRVVDLHDESGYYSYPHHFLLAANRTWFGRLYYQEVTTGDRESVVIWTVINGTITLYDFREYSRGGARGVNTPDKVVGDLTEEISDEFTGVADYYIQQPTLYKTRIEDKSILVWVSLIIQRKQGADELIGAAFIDAANTRIVGVKTRSVGEPLEVFKDRLDESIEQTYLSFGVDEQAGESQTIIINNGTILVKEWTGWDAEGRKTYVFRVRDEETNETYLMVIKWSESGTGADYYRAAAAAVGERYYFKARFDKDEQVFVMISTVEL
ncbi:MAG: hypothetical protein ACFFD4_21565 [Candidatus Odinarchaeota archaeon]